MACVRGIGRSCGCERCESESNWYSDWLGNIVEVEEEVFPGFEDDDLFACDDEDDEEEE